MSPTTSWMAMISRMASATALPSAGMEITTSLSSEATSARRVTSTEGQPKPATSCAIFTSRPSPMQMSPVAASCDSIGPCR